MNIAQISQPVSPGKPAPDFTLPAVDGSGTGSLADYRGGTPLFLALFIGLWCPFCRRAIAQIAASEPALNTAGVETLARRQPFVSERLAGHRSLTLKQPDNVIDRTRWGFPHQTEVSQCIPYVRQCGH
jgi:hypothetical protein